MTLFDISNLFSAANINFVEKGTVSLYDRMEIPEDNPYDEWIYLGLMAMKMLRSEGCKPHVVADIGTGNGILAIGLAHVFNPKKIFLTDIVPEVLSPSESNLRENIASLGYEPEIICEPGRDSSPLQENSTDLIMFSPPPLMVDSKDKLTNGLSRTTLIERSYYEVFASGEDDPLLKWSTLPLCVFLQNAKTKLKESGVILVLYSGRIPLDVIKETYDRAGIKMRIVASILKKQQDPIYLLEYARYEKKYLGSSSFYFYDYEKAQRIMQSKHLDMPGILSIDIDELILLLEETKISAQEAYELSQKGKSVAHIGHAILGF